MAKGFNATAREKELQSLRVQVGRLRTALAPFADIADLVNHTPQRDGEIVYRLPNPCGGYFTLERNDFRRAAAALIAEQRETP